MLPIGVLGALSSESRSLAGSGDEMLSITPLSTEIPIVPHPSTQSEYGILARGEWVKSSCARRARRILIPSATCLPPHLPTLATLARLMGKARPVNDEPVAAAVPNKDVLQRLSYLYQASILLNTALHAGAGTVRGTKGKQRQHDAEPAKEFLIPTQADATMRLAGEQDAPDAVPPPPTLPRHGEPVELEGSKLDLPLASTSKARSVGHSALPATSRLLVKTMREVAKKATVRM